jgi:hypothetical protein
MMAMDLILDLSIGSRALALIPGVQQAPSFVDSGNCMMRLLVSKLSIQWMMGQ